ncbi:MAG: hypothetical protein U0289_09685 [Cyclobacteriaceae bacterium]
MAACKNASAMLFVGAKISQYAPCCRKASPSALNVQRRWWPNGAEDGASVPTPGACEAECPEAPIKITNIA